MLRRSRHGITTLATWAPRPRTPYRCINAPDTRNHGFATTSTLFARKKAVVKIADLPQGTLKADALPVQIDDKIPQYPTVVLQARQNMDKFDNCVLLTRVGGFYELYFEHAQEFGPLLNLKVASKKTAAGPVPMVSPRDPHHYRALIALGWLSILPT